MSHAAAFLLRDAPPCSAGGSSWQADRRHGADPVRRVLARRYGRKICPTARRASLLPLPSASSPPCLHAVGGATGPSPPSALSAFGDATDLCQPTAPAQAHRRHGRTPRHRHTRRFATTRSRRPTRHPCHTPPSPIRHLYPSGARTADRTQRPARPSHRPESATTSPVTPDTPTKRIDPYDALSEPALLGGSPGSRPVHGFSKAPRSLDIETCQLDAHRSLPPTHFTETPPRRHRRGVGFAD